MGSFTVANTLCGALVAALNRFPFVGGCSPIMTESFEHDVLGLGLRPICGKGCGVSAGAVGKALRLGYYRIGCLYGFGFNFARVGFVGAGRSAVIAAFGFRPIIGRLVPFGNFRPLRIEEEAGTAVSCYIGSDFGNRPFGEFGILVPAVEVIAVSCGNGKNGFRSENMGFGCSLGKRSA